jgi:hypothetical protein
MMMKQRDILLFLLLLVLAACHSNPLKVNVSGINLAVKAERLDQDLFKVTPANIALLVPELQLKYGDFFSLYNHEVLAIGDSRDSLYNGYLLTFLEGANIPEIRSKSDSLFHDFRPYEQQFELAFKHLRYYYPGIPVPKIYTYLSEFNQSIVTMPGAIGISLDNYLGSDCKFYRLLGWPVYKRANLIPEKLLYDALYGWASQQFEYKGVTENLISAMIYQGKLLYLMDALVPDGADSLKIGYKKEQLNWCKAHETEMWNSIVENKMLFSGDRMNLVRFINPAPFTTHFGQKSPGKTGVWIGWQIVRSYMSKNPAITLPGLMEENDYHKILNESGYAPD